MSENKEKQSREKSIEKLVNDCVLAHQEAIIVQLIYRLEKEYKEVAMLASLGEYQETWTHQKLLDYVTYET
jgi:flagellar biosynthesis/type III secretory pathway ATPase